MGFVHDTYKLNQGLWNLLFAFIAFVLALVVGSLVWDWRFAEQGPPPPPPTREERLETCMKDVAQEHRSCSQSILPELYCVRTSNKGRQVCVEQWGK